MASSSNGSIPPGDIFVRKYIEIAKLSFKSQLTWRFDILFNMLYTIARILFAVVVWGVIFRENTLVGGFTYQAMLSYYVASSFFSQIEATHSSTDEIIRRIRGGAFSGLMVTPVNVEGRFLAMSVGGKLFHGIFLICTAIFCALLFRIPFAFASRPWIIVGAFVLEMLGLLFIMQLNFLIGVLAFKLENTWVLSMIKNNIIAFATGVIVPLALLPEVVREAFALLPFYYVTYLPSMLLIGLETERLYTGFAVLMIWCAALFFMNRWIYDTLRKKYEGVGI